MKKMYRFLCAGILAAALLAGCGSKADRTTYVKGVLDIVYNQGTEDYEKAAGVKEAEAKKDTTQALQAEAKVLAAYFGIESPSKNVQKSLQDLAGKIYKKASYTVKENGDNVEVSIKPLKVFEEDSVQSYIDDFDVKEFVDGDKSCTDEEFVKGLAKVVEKALEKPSYDKEVTITVPVKEKSGKYTIADEDLVKVDEKIVVY